MEKRLQSWSKKGKQCLKNSVLPVTVFFFLHLHFFLFLLQFPSSQLVAEQEKTRTKFAFLHSLELPLNLHRLLKKYENYQFKVKTT